MNWQGQQAIVATMTLKIMKYTTKYVNSRGAARKNRLLQFREFSYDISHVG